MLRGRSVVFSPAPPFFSGAILRDSAFFLCVKLVAVGERKAVREYGRVR